MKKKRLYVSEKELTDGLKIMAIATRVYYFLGPGINIRPILFDLYLVNTIIRLRLNDMITADIQDLMRDIKGIHDYLNRECGWFTAGFTPRFAKKKILILTRNSKKDHSFIASQSDEYRAIIDHHLHDANRSLLLLEGHLGQMLKTLPPKIKYPPKKKDVRKFAIKILSIPGHHPRTPYRIEKTKKYRRGKMETVIRPAIDNHKAVDVFYELRMIVEILHDLKGLDRIPRRDFTKINHVYFKTSTLAREILQHFSRKIKDNRTAKTARTGKITRSELKLALASVFYIYLPDKKKENPTSAGVAIQSKLKTRFIRAYIQAHPAQEINKFIDIKKLKVLDHAFSDGKLILQFLDPDADLPNMDREELEKICHHKKITRGDILLSASTARRYAIEAAKKAQH